MHERRDGTRLVKMDAILFYSYCEKSKVKMLPDDFVIVHVLVNSLKGKWGGEYLYFFIVYTITTLFNCADKSLHLALHFVIKLFVCLKGGDAHF